MSEASIHDWDGDAKYEENKIQDMIEMVNGDTISKEDNIQARSTNIDNIGEGKKVFFGYYCFEY